MEDEPRPVNPNSVEQSVFAEAMLCPDVDARALYLDRACGNAATFVHQADVLVVHADVGRSFQRVTPLRSSVYLNHPVKAIGVGGGWNVPEFDQNVGARDLGNSSPVFQVGRCIKLVSRPRNGEHRIYKS